MRRSLVLLLALAACATEQTVPLAVLSEHPAQGAARTLPVVPLRWESQPDLSAAACAGGAPVSLTASDGTGLEIRALDATAVIEDPLAFTELHFVFRNPAPRPVEGRFEITLPPNAAISRFAMRQSDGWQEGEVVEREAARAAYEDFLHRRSDPALLEKQAGNRFQARVFPIPASGEKEIVFSYSQELTRAEDPYRLYLRGLPRIGAFDLRVLYDRDDDPASPGRKSYELHETGFTPERDFRLALPAASPVAHGLRRERLSVARITPIAEAAPDPVASLLVLFDTSASRSLGFRAEVDRLGDIVDALKRTSGYTVPLVVACFDQEVAVVHDGTAGEFGRRELDAVLARKALGASDLGKALHFASTFTPRSGARPSRVLVVSDGVVTAGEQDAADLDPLMRDLRKAGVERLDAVIDGGIHDEALAKQLAVGKLPRDGVVLDIELGPNAIAERLGRRAVSGIKVEVPGSAWVWPRVLNGVQPGDQVVVYASIPEDRPFEVALQGPVSSRQTIRTGAVERPLIERAMVSAEIQRLSAERSAAPDDETREGLRQRIIALSTKHRVLSDDTALLVLETEQDYARFKIDRQALADILTVGPTGVELLDRNKPKMVAAEIAEAAPPSPDTIAFNKTKAPARNNLVAPAPRATTSWPSPCCARAGPKRRSRLFSPATCASTRTAGSAAPTGSCARTWGSSRRRGSAPSPRRRR
jgi:Vault protein inter-alpha-trypsin domain